MLSPVSAVMGDHLVIWGSNPPSDNVKVGNHFFHISTAVTASNMFWLNSEWKNMHFYEKFAWLSPNSHDLAVECAGKTKKIDENSMADINQSFFIITKQFFCKNA